MNGLSIGGWNGSPLSMDGRPSVSGGRFHDELTTRPFFDFIHPDDQARILGRYRIRVKGEYVTESPQRFVIPLKTALLLLYYLYQSFSPLQGR